MNLILLLILLGLIGSFFSGLVGVGGAIVMYPLLLFIPPLFGFEGFSSLEVSGLTSFQVFFSTLSGVITYKKGGELPSSLVWSIGIPALISSFVGGFFSKFVPDSYLNMLYGILAVVAVVLMFKPDKDNLHNEMPQKSKMVLSILVGSFVGVVAGMIGAGGSFLFIPLMIQVIKVPTRLAIAASLAITFLSSIGTVIGKIFSHNIDYHLAIYLAIAGLIGAPIGVRISKKLSVQKLQWIFSALLIVTAIKIWWGVLIH
ncbi:sulfite exporter TauE/SafE family protein [Rummeliibacillus pycnus]|uniref:sulfite exporter TauE/SafE family protein n=1 Tax=Rummeliibacillus pycnus TaxID=101070 RepID=UPI0014736E2D|nr:sulfite exporter TauE/SafE family protein [Rummeliibacillus pycnus]